MGSALGGFTAQPARSYPHLFSPDGIFGEYPYLLPNLVAVAVFVVAILQGWLFLEETNPRPAAPATKVRVNHVDRAEHADETTPLRPRQRRESGLSAISSGPGGIAYLAGSAPTPTDPAFDLRRSSFASIGSFKPLMKLGSRVEAVIEDDDDHDDDEEPGFKSSEPIKAFNKGVIMWTVAIVLMCYHTMAFGSLLPVYLLDDPRQPPGRLDLQGGLGMTLPQVGTYLAVTSVMSLFSQGVIFPVFVSKLGVWKAAVSMTLICPLIHIAMPFVTLLPDPGVGVYVVLALQSLAAVITYPTLLILLKNATESPLVLGKVNGLAMSACSAARTVGPPLVGIIYSALGSAAAWFSCGIVAIACIVEIYFTPRPTEDTPTIMRRASIVAVEVPPMVDLTRDREEH